MSREVPTGRRIKGEEMLRGCLFSADWFTHLNTTFAASSQYGKHIRPHPPKIPLLSAELRGKFAARKVRGKERSNGNASAFFARKLARSRTGSGLLLGALCPDSVAVNHRFHGLVGVAVG